MSCSLTHGGDEDAVAALQAAGDGLMEMMLAGTATSFNGTSVAAGARRVAREGDAAGAGDAGTAGDAAATAAAVDSLAALGFELVAPVGAAAAAVGAGGGDGDGGDGDDELRRLMKQLSAQVKAERASSGPGPPPASATAAAATNAAATNATATSAAADDDGTLSSPSTPTVGRSRLTPVLPRVDRVWSQRLKMNI